MHGQTRQRRRGACGSETETENLNGEWKKMAETAFSLNVAEPIHGRSIVSFYRPGFWIQCLTGFTRIQQHEKGAEEKKRFRLTFGCNFNVKSALESENMMQMFSSSTWYSPKNLPLAITFLWFLQPKKKRDEVEGGERKCILNVKTERKNDEGCLKVVWVAKERVLLEVLFMSMLFWQPVVSGQQKEEVSRFKNLTDFYSSE